MAHKFDDVEVHVETVLSLKHSDHLARGNAVNLLWPRVIFTLPDGKPKRIPFKQWKQRPYDSYLKLQRAVYLLAIGKPQPKHLSKTSTLGLDLQRACRKIKTSIDNAIRAAAHRKSVKKRVDRAVGSVEHKKLIRRIREALSPVFRNWGPTDRDILEACQQLRNELLVKKVMED